MYVLTDYTNRIDQAVKEFENRQQRELFRPDGSKRYSDKEHNEILAGLIQPVLDACDTAIQQADERVKSEQTRLELLDNANPLDTLTADELVRANVLARFVAEDAQTLPLPKLASRLKAAIAKNDKVSMVLYHRYAVQRDEQISEAWRTNPDAPIAREEMVHRREFSATLQAMGGKLADPKLEEKRKDATETIAAVQKVRMDAIRQRNAVDGTEERARREVAQLYSRF
jgi:Spy/CpxP family protein refolding chaperone